MEIGIDNKQLNRSIKLRLIAENKTNFEEIEELSLINRNFLGKNLNIDLEEICKIRDLKKLSIKFFTINEKIIKAINSLEKLETLEIYMCKLETQEKLNGNLKNISLYNVENLNLDIIKTDFVEIFRIENSGLADLYKFYKFDYLKRLEIVNCPIISGPKLNLLKSLEELHLQNIDLQFDLEIDKLENLQFISLNGCKVYDKDEYIKRIKKQNSKLKIEFKDDNNPIE